MNNLDVFNFIEKKSKKMSPYFSFPIIVVSSFLYFYVFFNEK